MSFWADKLNAPAAPAAGEPPRPAPASAPAGAWWAPQAAAQPQAPPQYAPDTLAVYVPATPPPHVRQLARQSAVSCPECGSEDYFEVDRHQGPRCYACGATTGNRTRNSTQGMTAVSQRGSGPPRAARQVSGPGYRPDIIVGSL
jgi:hypothetical protein